MKNKKFIVCIFILFLVGMAVLLLRNASKYPLLGQLEMVKKTATHMDLINNNILYDNFHKRFDISFLQSLLGSIDFEDIEKISDNTFSKGNKGCGWNTWFRFYNDDALIYTITKYADGRICANGEWYAYLTKESKPKLDELLASVGLTDELGPLPLAANLPAATNVVFRKESTVPYTMNDAIFIMPDEQFSVGITEYEDDSDYPGYYKIHYRADQNYQDSLDLHFHVGKLASGKQQARLDIKNNSSDRIGFDLSYLIPKEVIYGHELYELGRDETLSIEADPDASCYVLGSIRNLY